MRLNFWQAVVFLFVMSLALALFLFLLQPLPFSYVISAVRRSFGLGLFVNWLPLFLVMLFLYFAGAGAATSSTIVGAIGIALGFANRTKILLRNDPLMPWDLLLGGEVAGIAHSFGAGTIAAIVGGIILYILAAVVFAFVIRSEKIDMKIRAAGVAASLILPFAINAPLYNNPDITERLYIHGNIWNQVNQFNSRGFLFSFIHAFNTNRVMRPEGYDPNEVIHMMRKFATGADGLARQEGETHPHIIMIQSEAFSELSTSFCFDGFQDPLENWWELVPEGIHGEIVVSVIGGGTAQTEFDVLTGLNSRQFAGVPFAFRMITDEFESMASILNLLGYRSEFMHPGFGWFYNRQNVYRHLGFERLMFIDEFEGIPTRSGYVSEYATITRVKEMFAEHRENFPNVPYFNFTVTIQNHGPYVDKFRWDGFEEIPNFNTDLPLLDVDINALSNYFHGLKDADAELSRLVNYLRELDEPVVLVYFSDHLPAFNARIYDVVLPNIYTPGSFEDLARLFRVPFLIWMNDTALELYDITHPQELAKSINALWEIEDEPIFSAPFFGAYVMELLGFTNISPFWDFNTRLRREWPIVMEERSFAPCLIVNSDMHFYGDVGWLPVHFLRDYRNWSYFRLFDER
ncbi:MAG: LTA synthase family protein [Defluviitaleaceae bacterium]|nr:LTA synthase family protein [Defluviitaleaceae bacterium]MCL2262648.1 LTA synthase family protein [Defluviitaleaceae bacterium]